MGQLAAGPLAAMSLQDAMSYDRLAEIERINVIGTSGSGKSTLSRSLSQSLGLPCIEMDAVYWGANWQEPTDDEFLSRIKTITDGTQWILDGNYSRTTTTKWSRVQLVIWMDLPFLQTIYRVTRRCIQRSVYQTEIWPGTGNRETLRKAFLSRDSVILWALSSYRNNRRRYAKMMTAPEFAHIWFVRLQDSRDVNELLMAAEATTKRSA